MKKENAMIKDDSVRDSRTLFSGFRKLLQSLMRDRSLFVEAEILRKPRSRATPSRKQRLRTAPKK